MCGACRLVACILGLQGTTTRVTNSSVLASLPIPMYISTKGINPRLLQLGSSGFLHFKLVLIHAPTFTFLNSKHNSLRVEFA